MSVGAGQIQGQVRDAHRVTGNDTVSLAAHRQRPAAVQRDTAPGLDAKAVIRARACVAAGDRAGAADGQRHRAARRFYGVPRGFDRQAIRRYADLIGLAGAVGAQAETCVDRHGPRRDIDLMAGQDRAGRRRHLQRRHIRHRDIIIGVNAAVICAGQLQGQVRDAHRAGGVDTVLLAAYRQGTAAAQRDVASGYDAVALLRAGEIAETGHRARAAYIHRHIGTV